MNSTSVRAAACATVFFAVAALSAQAARLPESKE